MAIFGTIVAFLIGMIIIIYSLMWAYAVTLFHGGGLGSFALIPFGVGAGIIFLACKFGAFGVVLI